MPRRLQTSSAGGAFRAASSASCRVGREWLQFEFVLVHGSRGELCHLFTLRKPLGFSPQSQKYVPEKSS